MTDQEMNDLETNGLETSDQDREEGTGQVLTDQEMRELIHTIVKPLVSHPEDIELNLQDTEDFHEYLLEVHPDDVGRVIGKRGRIAKAIRAIIYSIQYEGPKRVRLTIVD